jgi:aryl-alcohol dehydrogenase-like predicted oxidoreductase
VQYRKLGNTDIDVSVIAMGCWAIVGDATWGEQDEKDTVATLEAAVDCGVTLFDTAELYGDGYSEQVLGKVFAARRRDVVIASKVARGNLEPGALRAACEGSLKRLRTDYIDLYQVHWPDHDLPFEPTARALEQLQQEGKIRAFGVSNFGSRDLGDWLSVAPAANNQVAYNMLFRAVEFEIQPLCVSHNVSILCYSPLAQALLTGKFHAADDVPAGRARTRHFAGSRPEARHGAPGFEQETFAAVDRVRQICDEIGEPMADVALAWLLHQPGVASVLAGARRPDQVRQNAKAGDLRLSEDVVSRLNAATEPLKQAMGTNPDMWQIESRMR